MSRRSTRVPTPPRMRLAAFVSMTLGAFVGVYSAANAMSMGAISQVRPHEAAAKATAWMKDWLDPVVIEAMTLGHTAALSTLQSMSSSRALLLSILAVLCAAIFVCSGRMLRSDMMMPREGLRRMLSGSLLVSAALRTVLGAQELVATQRQVAAMRPVLEGAPELAKTYGDSFVQMQLAMPLIADVGLTAAVAGTLVVLGQYFRSQRVKQVVALQDEQLEQ